MKAIAGTSLRARHRTARVTRRNWRSGLHREEVGLTAVALVETAHALGSGYEVPGATVLALLH